MSSANRNTVVFCVTAIVIGGLLWKNPRRNQTCKAIGRGLVFFGVNRILPVLLD